MCPNTDTVALHGWTAVPVDVDAIFEGKPYLNEPTPVSLEDITWPSDDPIVAKVQEYAKEKLPIETYNHSMRVFHWATIIARQQFPTHASSLSPSTLALTCLLHDIGTTPANRSSTQLSFEFQGGFIAINLIQHQLGGAQSQAEAVAEAIIRHQDQGTVGTITFLGQLIQLATVYDNMSEMPHLVHPETRREVASKWKRNGWSRCFSKTIRAECEEKPWAHTTHLGVEKFPNGVRFNQLMEEYDSWTG
ncbi:hypothetical protein QBC32DRAFT_16820 [Pseudoneurospora amorphoporcata]|uniref:HD domain-containing protein n=1 Tax=Pseudoneurospora amorphoporcata TaxID=241081 RepID=A0AAN6SIQ6_9PEZI|nr:hypothetical protein QBC32DRAFT_16820 [Pseudoneurospora amorphoporcata]